MSKGNELGDFLRARRALVSPGEAGLPDHEPRRVEGLRREEVASLAGVSADYYTRLEQGRERRPSGQVLRAICRALQLDIHAAEHLANLARPDTRITPSSAPREASDGAIRILNNAVDAPAFVVSPALDILVMNDQALALYSDLSRTDNLAYMVFLDPAAKNLYVDWEEVARDVVRNLRAISAFYLDDARIAEVVGELTIQSETFALFWVQHDVRPRTGGSKRFRHRQVGEITLDYDSLLVADSPGQQLVIYSAANGSADADALALLSRLDVDSPNSP